MKTATLFVGNIPTDSTVEELRKFIKGGIPLSSRLLPILAYRIVQTRILRNVDDVSLETTFHGLVTVEPERIAERIIERLDSRVFKGKCVVVRRYRERRDSGDSQGGGR